MKKIGSLLIILSLASCSKCTGSSDVKKEDLTSEIDKVSYILGFSTGKSFSEQSVDVNTSIFVKGLKQGLEADSQPAMTEEEMREVMTTFRTSLMEKRKKESEVASKKNQEEADKFFKENKDKPGVKTLESGLQYKVIKEGTGPKAGADDSVTVKYTGTLLNGKTFDSTKDRGKPATFAVGTTIPGMSEALQMMPTGSEWKLFIPSDLAYGAQGAGSAIGPNQALVFDVTVISVEKAKKEAVSKKKKKS